MGTTFEFPQAFGHALALAKIKNRRTQNYNGACWVGLANTFNECRQADDGLNRYNGKIILREFSLRQVYHCLTFARHTFELYHAFYFRRLC